MTRRKPGLAGYTDLQLLAELLRRNEPTPGPNSMHFGHFGAPPLMAVVGIGKDHVAEILIMAGAAEALAQTTSESSA
jgi:hypothetical protein